MRSRRGVVAGIARPVKPRQRARQWLRSPQYRDAFVATYALALVAVSMVSSVVFGAVGGPEALGAQHPYQRAGSYRQDLADIEYQLRFERDRDSRINLLYQRGDLATKLAKYQDALDAYDAIVALAPNPDDVDAMQARFYQAEVYGQWGKYAEAIRAYEGIARRPAAAGGQYAKTAAGRISRIRRLDSYAARLGAEDGSAARARIIFEAADLYEKINDTGAAVAEYERFMREHPSHELAPEAQYHIGQAYARKGMNAEAVRAMQTVVDTYPASRFDSIALFQLGRLHLAQDRPGGQRRTFEDQRG